MKEKLESLILTMLIIFFILIALGCIGFEIYLWVRYGGLPPDEVPSWVHWLILGGK